MKKTLVTSVVFYINIFAIAILYAQQSSLQYFINSSIEDTLYRLADSIDFNIGYNSQYDIPYFYKTTSSTKITASQQRVFDKIISTLNKKDKENLFFSIILIRQAVQHKTDYFLSHKNWRNYTYCNNYLLPPTNEFHSIFKSVISKFDPDIVEIENQFIIKAREKVRWYYRYFEEPVDVFP